MKKQKIPPFHFLNKFFLTGSEDNPFETRLVFSFLGELKQDSMRKAVLHVIKSTPVLNTYIKEGKVFTRRKKLQKVNMDEVFFYDEIENANIDPLKGPINSKINEFLYKKGVNIHQSPPIAVQMIKTSVDSVVFIMKIHHSCCDAVGTYLILSRIFQTYNQLEGIDNKVILPEEPSDYHYKQLRKFYQKPSPEEIQASKAREGIKGVSLHDEKINAGEKGFLTYEIKGELLDKLKKLSKESSYSINDFLALAVTKAIDRLGSEKSAGEEYIRIEQVSNLRKYLKMAGGITNFLAPVQAYFKRSELDDLKSALNHVKAEMERVFSSKEDVGHLFRFPLAEFFPIKQTKKMMKKWETQMFDYAPLSTSMSNAGKVDGALEIPGNCSVKGHFALPAVSYISGNQWTFTTVGDVMTLALGYVDPIIKRSTCEKLLNYFKSVLSEIAQWRSEDLQESEPKEDGKKKVLKESLNHHPSSNRENINYKKNFLLLFLGRLVSDLGTGAFSFALSLFILDLTGSALIFSAILSLTLIPGILVNIFGGVFVDKHSKKRIIVFSDLISGIVVLAAMFFFMQLMGGLNSTDSFKGQVIFLISITAILLSLVQSYFGLAIGSSVPNIVHESNAEKANSSFHGIGAVVKILGPVLGAFLYAQFKTQLEIIFLVNGVSFILSGISEMFIRFHTVDKTLASQNLTYFTHLKDGFKYIRKEKVLSFLMFFIASINIVIAPLALLVLPFITYNILQVSGVQLSLIEAAFAVGGIIGAMWVAMSGSNDQMVKKFFKVILIQGVLVLLWIFPEWGLFSKDLKYLITIIFAVILVLLGIYNSIQSIPIVTYFQLRIPEHYRGRVFGMMNTAVMISAPIGIWLYGLFLEKFKSAWIYVILTSSILMIFGAFWAGRRKVMKQFMSEL